MSFIVVNSNFADAITGERIFPGDRVFDTGCVNVSHPYSLESKTLFLKEETIVRLAEDAGIACRCKRSNDRVVDERVDDVVEPAREMVGEDVGVGIRTVKVGKAKAGGRKSN
jgi:hypothetical protein